MSCNTAGLHLYQGLGFLKVPPTAQPPADLVCVAPSDQGCRYARLHIVGGIHPVEGIERQLHPRIFGTGKSFPRGGAPVPRSTGPGCSLTVVDSPQSRTGRPECSTVPQPRTPPDNSDSCVQRSAEHPCWHAFRTAAVC